MAEVYATAEDVQHASEREFPGSLMDWLQGRVDAAHRRLRAAAPGIDARVTAGTVERELVTDVIVGMVLRVARNPEGYTREQDGDYGYGRSDRVGSGVLEVTDEDLRTLGYGGSSTYTTTVQDDGLARAWIKDPCRSRR